VRGLRWLAKLETQNTRAAKNGCCGARDESPRSNSAPTNLPPYLPAPIPTTLTVLRRSPPPFGAGQPLLQSQQHPAPPANWWRTAGAPLHLPTSFSVVTQPRAAPAGFGLGLLVASGRVRFLEVGLGRGLLGMEGGSGGGGDVELACKTLQVEHKLFYFDLKENPRGRYLKISEKTSATRSTIIVPDGGIVWFFDLFDYYIKAVEQVVNKELQLDTKVFYFDIGENKRGRFLKVTPKSNQLQNGMSAEKTPISEASVSRNRSTIIVPAGSAMRDGWVAFRDILAQMNDELYRMQNSVPSEHLPGLSDDVGVGFIPGHNADSAPGTEINVERSVELLPPEEIGGMGVYKVIRADQKRFFFDLGSNNRGHFLRISEVAGADRSSIILPLSGLRQFHEAVGYFVEISKDQLEGMTGANVRTIEPGHR
ncbi:hypothetical protein Taro_028066, partial [Colocasia esculenta]|nr:hypothetical protein [Colocasia esculenta]